MESVAVESLAASKLTVPNHAMYKTFDAPASWHCSLKGPFAVAPECFRRSLEWRALQLALRLPPGGLPSRTPWCSTAMESWA